MALTLVTDPSLAGFNGLATVAEVTDYELSKRGTAYAALTTAAKEAIIINATRLLDQLSWTGYKTDPLQNHEFPRTGLWRDGGRHDDYYGDNLLYSSYQFDPATVPQFAKDACADLCLLLVASDVTASPETAGFKRIKVDTIELEIDPRDRLSWFQDSTRNLCWRWLKNQSKYNVTTVRVG